MKKLSEELQKFLDDTQVPRDVDSVTTDKQWIISQKEYDCIAMTIEVLRDCDK